MIAVIDYGIGNLGSIKSMLDRIGIESVITSDPSTIAKSDKLVLPGVGAFDRGMANLRSYGLLPILHDKVRNQRSMVLGICLGMQLLTSKSEEGREPGLGWIAGEAVRFRPGMSDSSQRGALPVPHMGWNETIVQNTESALFEGLGPSPRFYFVHSYYVRVDDPATTVARAHYGVDFTCALQQDNIFGVQFHPEKSHRFGMRLLANFAKL